MNEAGNIRSWAIELDELAEEQARRTAELPILGGPLALMPDAHGGYGCTVGSVIATEGAIIPSAVGVDIGCGMAAVETSLSLSQLPDNLDGLLDRIAEVIPAGMGKGHGRRPEGNAARVLDSLGLPNNHLTSGQIDTLGAQFGTLGSGNHFVEVCADENDQVWLLLHSGSRGIGNQLAQGHINLARQQELGLEDPDLNWFLQGTHEFNAYIRDMQWGQRYAMANREQMLLALSRAFFDYVGAGQWTGAINCHHNYAEKEPYGGKALWITRKGAIRAGLGELGLIPGSMGTRSYVTEGLGNPLSYQSSSHGAGRRMSRKRARRELSLDSFHEKMKDKTWQADSANDLLDEHPDAYKDIDQVMEAQKDLVKVRHELRAILNYKGTK
jgi:RNA-splicing ligase RtcB